MAGKTQTPAAACLTAEQPAALYAIPGGARSGSAWVDYRDAFLGSPAALQILEQRGLYGFGQGADMSAFAPNAHSA